MTAFVVDEPAGWEAFCEAMQAEEDALAALWAEELEHWLPPLRVRGPRWLLPASALALVSFPPIPPPSVTIVAGDGRTVRLS